MTEVPSHALLAEITAGLSTGSDLGDLLVRFLDPVVRLAGAQGGAVRVLGDAQPGEEPTQLRLVGQLGRAPASCDRQPAVDRHCGVCGEAADGDRVVSAADPAACRGGAGRRLIAVPLQHRGRVLGVYNLFFDAEVALGADVQALLRSVGELLGLALHNARLEAEHLRASLLHERQAMAAEVHDSMAQTLAFVKMRLPLLEDAVLLHDDALSMRYLDDVRKAVAEAHSSLREIVNHLRTRIDPRGLGPAIEGLAERFRERTGLALEVDNRLPMLTLGAERDAELFHIVQEALVNIARHARAHRARLALGGTPEGIEVTIDDDGVGPTRPAAGEPGHHGLEIMHERAARLGGALAVMARGDGGTRVRLVLAHEAEAAR